MVKVWELRECRRTDLGTGEEWDFWEGGQGGQREGGGEKRHCVSLCIVGLRVWGLKCNNYDTHLWKADLVFTNWLAICSFPL